MEELLALLRDGHARTVESLAAELHTDTEDVRRRMEYLEHMGVLRRVPLTPKGCAGCTGCGGSGSAACRSCLPEGGFQNMGEIWEVV